MGKSWKTKAVTLFAFHPGGDPGIAVEASSDRLSQTQAQTHCPKIKVFNIMVDIV